jgi:hypothetical protein
LSATLGFFTNMRRRFLPYLTRRRLRACRMRRRVTLMRPLNQLVRDCKVGSSWSFSRSFLVRKPSLFKSLRSGERTVRMGMGVLTLLHRDTCVSTLHVVWVAAECLSVKRVRRRIALARRRMLEISCRTDLGHSCWERLPLLGVGLRGNMVLAVFTVTSESLGDPLPSQ